MQRDGMPIEVVGVQAAGAAAYPASLAAGEPVQLAHMATMADGIAVGLPGAVPFEAVQRYVGEVRTVGEDSLSKALLLVLERAKLVVEPAGAAAVAAVLDEPRRFKPPVVVVLSGGNIDPLLLMRVIRHGMAAAGRYLSLRVRIPDTPGGLATLLAQLADLDVNIIEIVHERISETLRLDEVEVALQLETPRRRPPRPGPQHPDQRRLHVHAQLISRAVCSSSPAVRAAARRGPGAEWAWPRSGAGGPRRSAGR